MKVYILNIPGMVMARRRVSVGRLVNRVTNTPIVTRRHIFRSLPSGQASSAVNVLIDIKMHIIIIMFRSGSNLKLRK